MNTVKILTIRLYQNIAATLQTLIQDSKEKKHLHFHQIYIQLQYLIWIQSHLSSNKVAWHFIHGNFFKKLHFLKISRRIKENVISSVSIYISK